MMNSSVLTTDDYKCDLQVRLSAPKRRTATGMFAWTMATVYAFLLLSPFSIDLFTFSNSYAFEVPLLICVFTGIVANDPIARLVKSSIAPGNGYLYIAAVLMILLCFLGAVRGGSLGNSYGDLRGNLVLLLGLQMTFLARNKGEHASLFRLAIMSTSLSIAYWCFASASGTVVAKYSTCYMAAVAAILLSVELRLSRNMLLSLGCLIFLAGVSFFRQYWIVAVLASFFVLHATLTTFKGKSRRQAIALVLLCSIGALAFGYTKLGTLTNFFVNDKSRYIQGVGKTNEAIGALSGDGTMASSDSLRLAYFTYIAEKPQTLLLPHGLGYRSYIDKIDSYFSSFGTTGVNTIDSLILYFIFHYGLLLFLPFFFWLLLSFRQLCKSRGSIESILLYGILLVPALFDGGQAVVIYRSFWLGSFIGLITYRFHIS